MLFMVKLAEKHFYMFIIKWLFQCLLVEVMFGAIKLIFVAKYSLFWFKLSTQVGHKYVSATRMCQCLTSVHTEEMSLRIQISQTHQKSVGEPSHISWWLEWVWQAYMPARMLCWSLFPPWVHQQMFWLWQRLK